MLVWEKYWNLVDVVSFVCLVCNCSNVGLNINIASRCGEIKLVGGVNEKTCVGL